MSTSHETMTNSAYRDQETFTWPQKIWDAKLHDTIEFVDKTFDFYDHVLACEREFFKSWLSIIRWTDRKITHMAHDAVKEATPERAPYDRAKDYDRDKDMASKKS